MDEQDQLKRAYATLLSLKENLPKGHGIHEKYVTQYHEILEKLTSLGFDVSEFRIPENQIKPALASFNYRSGDKQYTSYSEVERSFLLLKLDALLNYFSFTNSGEGSRSIGFHV